MSLKGGKYIVHLFPMRQKIGHKIIKVVAAAIVREGTCLVAQRSGGVWDGYWEFPGGKIEEGETHEEALQREIFEELSLRISLGEHLCATTYEYPDFMLVMDTYLCTIVAGDLHLSSHKAVCWISPDEMNSLEWVPADVAVVEILLRRWTDEKT